MAEHPNAALIRRMHRALAEGNYPPVLREILAKDVVWHIPGRHPLAGEHGGIEAVLAAMGRFEELSGRSIRTQLHDLLAGDAHAVALLRAAGERAGRRYDAREVDIYHVQDGRITEFWSFSEDQRATDEFWS